jgi:hypothetical protein
VNFFAILRDSIESSSLNCFSLQFQHGISVRSQRKKVEKRKRGIEEDLIREHEEEKDQENQYQDQIKFNGSRFIKIEPVPPKPKQSVRQNIIKLQFEPIQNPRVSYQASNRRLARKQPWICEKTESVRVKAISRESRDKEDNTKPNEVATQQRSQRHKRFGTPFTFSPL